MDYIRTKIHAHLLSEEDRRLLRNGFSILPVIPELGFEEVNTCPYALDGSCEGVKDKEAVGRCFGNNRGYMKCEIYQICIVEEIEPNYKAVKKPQALQDTVVIHADDISQIHRGSEESLDEQLNEDIASFVQFEGLRKSLSRDSRWRYFY